MKSVKKKIIERVKMFSNIAESDFLQKIDKTAEIILEAFKAGRKMLIAGNGGSAADAQHFAAELVNRFESERRALPAISLTTDSSVLTSISNDYSFEQVFFRQVEALGQAGDIFFVISTSGNSKNILIAVEEAKKRGMTVIGLTGRDGGKLTTICDISLVVPAENIALIQEVHIMTIHIICSIVDEVIR